MKNLLKMLATYLRSKKGFGQRGASLLSYSIIVGLIALTSVAAVTISGAKVQQAYCRVNEVISRDVFGSPGPFICLGEEAVVVPIDPDYNGDSQVINIPEVYEPKDPNLVLVYEGRSASFTLTSNDSNGVIEWGDQKTSPVVAGSRSYSHTYTSDGPWTVNITGSHSAFRNTTKDTLTKVVSFGDVGLQSLNSAFNGVTQLQSIAALPDTVFEMSSIFNNATSVPSDIRNWNVSRVTDMSSAFARAVNFDVNIAFWDVSGVEDMSSMFLGANAFNTDISDWDTSSVTTLQNTFNEASSFDRPIGEWDVSRVTNFQAMFYKAVAFDQPLADWNIIAATDKSNSAFSSMFFGATAFNQPLNAWDMSKVETSYNPLTSMFRDTPSFEQELSTWCVPLHETAPNSFGLNSAMTSQPIWGSCGIPPFINPIILEYTGGQSVTITAVGNGVIDWGDGAYTPTAQTSTVSHMLPEGERIQVRIAGPITQLKATGPALISVVSFGDFTGTNLTSSFTGTDNLESLAALPASVTSLNNTFSGSKGILAGVENWDTSRVTTMDSTFLNA
ncbi:BspA family leucine-rich repeat surface protein, partial [Loktanella sp. DJP18]|uniref:BspA family leucine-rich repeat surface protein n=1 Tax=Loktanella sp. DJP18 TaxID=3409788 RepID=UPI003BB6E7F2